MLLLTLRDVFPSHRGRQRGPEWAPLLPQDSRAQAGMEHCTRGRRANRRGRRQGTSEALRLVLQRDPQHAAAERAAKARGPSGECASPVMNIALTQPLRHAGYLNTRPHERERVFHNACAQTTP